MPTAIEEADSGQLSDIDMDRSSMTSLTTSRASGFTSILPLARRKPERGIGRRVSDMQPVEDLPPSMFRRNSTSSRSLRLFGRFSSNLWRKHGGRNPSHFGRPQSVQVSDLAHPIHVDQGTHDSRKVIYDTRTHLHQPNRNFTAQVLFERLKNWTPKVQFTVFSKSLMITECQEKSR